MTDKEFEYSKKVTDRFLELCNEGKIFYHNEARVIEHLDKKYEPKSIADYSRLKSRNYKLIKEDLDNEKLAFIPFAGSKFIYKNLN